MAGGSLPPPFLSGAEARACAGSGKAARARRARLGKGGGERREGGRRAENSREAGTAARETRKKGWGREETLAGNTAAGASCREEGGGAGEGEMGSRPTCNVEPH